MQCIDKKTASPKMVGGSLGDRGSFTRASICVQGKQTEEESDRIEDLAFNLLDNWVDSWDPYHSPFRRYLQYSYEGSQMQLQPKWDKKKKRIIHPEEQFQKIEENNRTIEYQSEFIADALEENGIPAYDDQANVSLVGLRDFSVKQFNSYRQICIIPAHARKKRKPMVRDLDYFMSLPGNRQKCRMLVFNTGQRVKVSDLDAAIVKLKDVRRRLASDLRAEYGIDFQFANIELDPVRLDDDGQVSVHLHTHCLVKIPWYNKKQFQRLLPWIRKRWEGAYKPSCSDFTSGKRNQFHDAGIAREGSREFVKYMCKPSSLMQLPSDGIAALAKVMFKKRVVESFGEFRDVRRKLREDKMIPIKRTKDANDSWELVKSWNIGRREAQDHEENTQASENVKNPDQRQVKKVGVAPANQIRGFCRPGPYFGVRLEPAVLVDNYNGKPALLCDQYRRVEAAHIITKAADASCRRADALVADVEGAARYRVHTGSLSVGHISREDAEVEDPTINKLLIPL